MNRKLTTSVLFALLALFSKSQTLQKIPLKIGLPSETSSKSVFKRNNIGIPRRKYPLAIIDGKQFKHCDFSNVYYDISNILDIRIFSRKQDSAKLYGSSSRHGVIIITTKKTIDWISVGQLLTQFGKGSSLPVRKIMLNINGYPEKPNRNVRFDKNVIAAAYLSRDTTVFDNNKEHHRMLFVQLSFPTTKISY